MKSTNHSSTGKINPNSHQRSDTLSGRKDKPPKPSIWGPPPLVPPGIRTTGREYVNPVDYEHPYPSMKNFADFLALRYDANRTRHAYYRQLRLIHEHCDCDPVAITESRLRDYFLLVKLKKHWKPKTIRQAVASAKMCFVELLGHCD